VSFVLDNSVTMRWLLNDGRAQDANYAEKVLLTLKNTDAVVPSLWALEVANVVAKIEAKGMLTAAITQSFVSTLNLLNIITDKTTSDRALGEVLNLARRYKLSAYDAAYLELAIRSNLALATLDADLTKAAKKAGVVILS
jgi:predicted nucleic acid-binding protein